MALLAAPLAMLFGRAAIAAPPTEETGIVPRVMSSEDARPAIADDALFGAVAEVAVLGPPDPPAR